MNDMENDYEKIVSDLNQELYDRFGEVESSFSYCSNGGYLTISFDNMVLWDSESDDRAWVNDEEMEPLDVSIRKAFNNKLDKLYSLKLP
jgi:hypothetical protein